MSYLPRTASDLLRALALAAVFASVGVATLSLPATGVALYRMIWLPTGIAVAWLMLGGIRLWPGVVLGAALTTALTGGTPAFVAGTAFANGLEAVLAVWLFRRWGLGHRIGSRHALGVFLAGLVAATSLAAILSVGSLMLGQTTATPSSIWLMWWLTHVMGGIVLTPLILSIPYVPWPVADVSKREAALMSVGFVVALMITFTPLKPAGLLGAPIAFVTFPFLFWAAYRGGQFGASLASLIAAAFAVVGTLLGAGPFAHESPNTSLFLTLLFVAGVEFSTLFVAGLVGERRAAEAERERLERRLHRSEMLESLGALAGGIAHDFNNLLVAIAGNVDLVLMSTDPEDPSYQPLEESVRASERAAELCRQLLGYAGQGPFERVVLDLGTIIRDMTELLRVTVPKGMAVEYDLPTTPLPIRADPNQIRQVLISLLSNAGDAMSGGEGRVRVSLSRVRPGFAQSEEGLALLEPPPGACAMLRVEDDGEGIPPENLERVFQPMFSTRALGRGMGFASVLGIVQRHEASIHVSSTPGAGSAFTVLFPLEQEPIEAQAPAPQLGPLGDGGTALIVDDEESVRETASLLIRRLGFETVEAVDGETALAELERRDGRVSWILMDVTMPAADGLDVVREIRRRGWKVPVLVSSGYVRQPDEIGDLAPARFLAKPYTLAALGAAVDELLKSA